MKGVFEKKRYFGLIGSYVEGFRGYSPQFHTHGEVIFVLQGEIKMLVEGQEITVKEGEMMLLFPYLVHSYEEAPDARVILVLFDPVETVFDNTFLTQKPRIPTVEAKRFQPLLERVVYWSKKRKIKTAFSYLNAVLGEFLEEAPMVKSDHTIENTAVRILEYCAEHFTENITVKSVSEALYISQSQISKTFSEKLRYGFREYINSLRVQKAKSLLQHSDKRIVDIMLDCGFQNQSSFNRIFRSYLNLSPREYQKICGAQEKDEQQS